MGCETRGLHGAVLLAAGGSTRLGAPKQLLTRGGETLLHRAARLLQATRPARLVVVLGFDAARLLGELDGIDCTIVVNEDWARGLSTSLQAAARELGDVQRVLVSVCDQPALDARHLDALLRASGCAATRHGDRLGVPALLDAATWSRVHELTGDRGFGALLDARECTAIDAPELGFDLDTPGDVEAARRRGWLD